MSDLERAIRGALGRFQLRDLPALPGRRNHIRAGVLVPLVLGDAPRVILTLRQRGIRHGGEVSFPGGRPEPQDESLQETAVREAREEIGIEQANVLGRLSSIPVYTSDHRLEPFVATVNRPFTLNAGEVAALVPVDLEDAFERPSIDAIRWEHGGQAYLSPVFVTGDLAIFGATAHTLLELLGVLAPVFGQSVPDLKPGRFTWDDLVEYRASAAKHH